MKLLLVFLAILCLAGCPDSTVAPGGIEVNWTLSGVITCDDWGIEHVEARAIRGDTVEDRVTAECKSTQGNGLIVINNLPPTRYTVEVEGLDADGIGRFLGTATSSVQVRENATTSTSPISLKLKSGAMSVDWTLPGGGKCSSARVQDVNVQLYDEAGYAATRMAITDCDGTFEDPEDDLLKAGVLFLDIQIASRDGMNVGILVTGCDEAGTAVAEGAMTGILIKPGDRLDKVVSLRDCTKVKCSGTCATK